MKRLKQQLKRKLRSQAGESIGETLVALLVSALALVMLAGAIASGTNVITRSRNQLKEYYDAAEGIVQRSSDGKSGSITITVTDESNAILTESYNITYYKNDAFSKTPVIAYKYKNSNDE